MEWIMIGREETVWRKQVETAGARGLLGRANGAKAFASGENWPVYQLLFESCGQAGTLEENNNETGILDGYGSGKIHFHRS
jgi:hypothetical protein